MRTQAARVVLGIFPNMQIEKVRQSLPEVTALCQRLHLQVALPESLAGKYQTLAYPEGPRGKSGAKKTPPPPPPPRRRTPSAGPGRFNRRRFLRRGRDFFADGQTPDAQEAAGFRY
jgi:hypothetical protein